MVYTLAHAAFARARLQLALSARFVPVRLTRSFADGCVQRACATAEGIELREKFLVELLGQGVDTENSDKINVPSKKG